MQTILTHLNKLRKVIKCRRELPHELTPAEALSRLDCWMKCVIIFDKKWVYFSKHDKEIQWLDLGQMIEPVSGGTSLMCPIGPGPCRSGH